MNMKIIGKILLAIAFLYFVAGVWGWYNNHGVPGAIVGTFILALFIGGVWCLTAMGRTRLGLRLMIIPLLANIAGIWGGYYSRIVLGGEVYVGGFTGAMINGLALIIFVFGLWCLTRSVKEISVA
jgi:hypothetical protein